MCIYLGKGNNLTYNNQEHVLPAALGCCTKLDKGMVSDEANEYFSPIERDVIENSLIQVPRIIKGPGKRGKLSARYATTSKVLPIKQNGRNALGYMKGTEGHILSQFIIDEKSNIQFNWQNSDNSDIQDEIQKLKKHIISMEEKYVPVEMPQDDTSIYITYFKNKIHIGYNGILPEEKIKELKKMFTGDITTGGKKNAYGQLSTTLEIEHNIKNLCIVAAKSAINTLAYLKGSEYIIQSRDFDIIIKQVISGSDDILSNVKGITFDGVQEIRQKLYLDNEQQACILREEMNQIKALVFFYNQGFEVLLCESLKSPSNILMDGIVCDWKNRKDYRYLDFLRKKGIRS